MQTAETTFTHFAFYPNAAPQALPLEDFRAWKHEPATDLEQLTRLALNAWIRNRGGIEGLKTVHVYRFPDDAPRHPKGHPRQVTAIEFAILTD